MKHQTTTRFAAVFGLLCALSLGVGQAAVTSTTLSAAVTSIADQTVVVASAANITARSRSQAQGGVGSSTTPANLTLLYMDREAMEVEKVNGTTITVRRGAQGTGRTKHSSGAKVWVAPAGNFGAFDRSGPCSTTVDPLPAFNLLTGKRFNCADTGWYEESTPSALITANCSGTVGSAETAYLNDAACSGATTVTAARVMPTAGVLANLRVRSSAAAVGGSAKDVLTVLKNGSATALTCTIAASGTTCSDLTDKVAVAAGDVLTFKFVTATSDTAADISVGLEKYQLQ